MTAPTLAHQTVSTGTPSRWGLVLHGILGSKTNWRTVMRRVAAELPSWGFVLADLRNHGDSQGFAPPHTLDAVAGDLAALAASLTHPFDAAIGHSYGAKAALAYADLVRGAIDHAVIVDGNPGARPDARGAEGTVRVVEALASLGDTFASREAFHDAMRSRGFSEQLVAWVAMNLVARDDAFRLRTDVDAVRAMLDDYFARDLWTVVEDPPGRVRVHALVGGRSSSLDAADRARLFAAAARRPDRVRAKVIAEADHWVHVDAPDATVAFLVEALGEARG